MSEAERPDPDAILARMKREETAATRGKLKIFFGMSPGVGKTYAMLQAARQKQAEGCEAWPQGNGSIARGDANHSSNPGRVLQIRSGLVPFERFGSSFWVLDHSADSPNRKIV